MLTFGEAPLFQQTMFASLTWLIIWHIFFYLNGAFSDLLEKSESKLSIKWWKFEKSRIRDGGYRRRRVEKTNRVIPVTFSVFASSFAERSYLRRCHKGQPKNYCGNNSQSYCQTAIITDSARDSLSNSYWRHHGTFLNIRTAVRP